MARPRLPLAKLALFLGAICLIGQAIFLWWIARHGGPGGSERPLLILLSAFVFLLTGIFWLSRRPFAGTGTVGTRRLLLLLSVAAQLWLAWEAAALVMLARRGAEPWVEEQRQELLRVAAEEEEWIRALGPGLEQLAAAQGMRQPAFADLFAEATRWTRAWPDHHPAPAAYPLAVAIWQGDRRVAWADQTAPLAWPAAGDIGNLVDPGHDWWYWRSFVPLVAATGDTLQIELQVRLAALNASAGEEAGQRTAAGAGARVQGAAGGGPRDNVTLHREFRNDYGLLRNRVVGSVEQGLRLTHDVSLTTPTLPGRQDRLRVTAYLPPRAALDGWIEARRFASLLAAWSLAALAWSAAVWGALGLLGAAWAARLVLAGSEFFHWLQLAHQSRRLAALPGELASLVDPAYFATPFVAGWFASAADAVLTALLLLATARFSLAFQAAADARSSAAAASAISAATASTAATDSGGAPRSSLRWWQGRSGRILRAVAFGLLAGLGLLALRVITLELAENANPRLIGPQIPYRFLSFWTLHLALLLVSLAVLTGLASSAIGLRRTTARREPMLTSLVVPVTVWIVLSLTRDLAADFAPIVWPVLLIGAALSLVLWWMAPLAAQRRGLTRRLVFATLLLLVVTFNYSVLHEHYGAAERLWLEGKAAQIVQSQEDWVTFLLEDALAEMETVDAESGTATDRSTSRNGQDSVAGGAGSSGLGQELWRNEAAHRLWQVSAIRDLGLPCLVEITDPDGLVSSLFAAGFLRDLDFEVTERRPWREVEPLLHSATILVQSERRRYPGGIEEIMRGEVERGGGRGWIRVELPLQSKRISTLRAQLEGLQTGDPGGGYRPRAEIDRPLLLVRGMDSGWIDAGAGDFPSPAADAVAASLRAGNQHWGLIEVGDDAFLCLWAPLEAASQEHPGEGFLLGLQVPGVLATLLDLSRLVLLNTLLLLAVVFLYQLARWLGRRRRRPQLGFQERFLAGFLILGIFVLLMAGLFVDRLTREGIEGEAREQTREGLSIAVGQLRGLLAEQARALASSDYIADLLANRLRGQRPVGPFALRQGMVFQGDGRLLLDETLSDLDAREAEDLLEAARAAPLVAIIDGDELYLGTLIPIDLSDALAADPDTPSQPEVSPAEGFFFYRQGLDADLLASLGQVTQGELTFRFDGEAVLASHPARVLSGRTPVLGPPAMMEQLLRHPASPYLHPAPPPRLAFTGGVAMPALAFGDTDRRLIQSPLPAVLAVEFPDRERDYAAQRERTVLYLAGLATLILLAALVMVLGMTWNIFGPVRVLVHATQRLADGDFAAPLPARGRDEVGRLAGSFGRMRDQLGAARDRLAARERFLSTVLNRVPVGVLVWSDEGQVVSLNPAGVEILRAFAAEPSGEESDITVQAGRLLDALGSKAGRLGAEIDGARGNKPAGEAELRSADGRRTLRGRLAPLVLPDGREDTMLVFEDLTEFLATQRLALNAELARHVAHEIKNPLTPIQLSVQHLHQAFCDDHPQLESIVDDTVKRILEQVALLRSIAAEFSLLGKPGELECAPLDWRGMVEKLVAAYQVKESGDGEGIVVNIAANIAADDPPLVVAHADSLRKVLANLMQNSLDARGEAGALIIDVSWVVGPREVTMYWRDNGSGLTDDVAERLFDPYFSTKSKGTGLGLAICRNLMDKMAGRIDLSNRSDGAGAVAQVILPRVTD